MSTDEAYKQFEQVFTEIRTRKRLHEGESS